jgi:hypothetical protein
VPEVSSEDSSSKSKNAITREESRSVELGRKEFPTWRVTNDLETTLQAPYLGRGFTTQRRGCPYPPDLLEQQLWG